MAQFGKASSKRGKPTYAYAIIGVALVLFLFGIVGWFFLNLRKTGDYLKENVQVQAFLNRDINPAAYKKRIDSLQNYIKSFPYVKSAEYVTREEAIKRWESREDTAWKKFIKDSPLPESIDFFVKANYVQTDSLNAMAEKIQSTFPGLVSDVNFSGELVTKVGSFAKNFFLCLLIIAIILTILVIFSIDNTIRLAMYSNRFLIKTMQMVGATRWFIAKPLNVRAIINGIIASVVAILLVQLTVFVIEKAWPEFKVLNDNTNLILLFLVILLMGISITLVSTHRAVIKYLRMKLDDLY